jgi:hypothetical protein
MKSANEALFGKSIAVRRTRSGNKTTKSGAISSVAFLLLVLAGCGAPNSGNGGSGGVGGNNGGGGGNGGGSGSTTTSVWPADDESAQGLVMHTQQLTTNQCVINPNQGFSIAQTTAFWAESWARYKASFWALDQNNAQLCQSGQAFQGVPLAPQGEYGFNSITLAAGTYFLAILDLGNASNAAGVELDTAGGPPGRTFVGSLFNTVAKSVNPEGWVTIPFIIRANTVAWLDGGNSGGVIYMMTPSQAQTFQSQYPNGFTGGTISFIDDANNNPSYCGLNGSMTMDAPEDCDLTSHLVPGSYVLVYINNTSFAQSLTAWGVVYQ